MRLSMSTPQELCFTQVGSLDLHCLRSNTLWVRWDGWPGGVWDDPHTKVPGKHDDGENLSLRAGLYSVKCYRRCPGRPGDLDGDKANSGFVLSNNETNRWPERVCLWSEVGNPVIWSVWPLRTRPTLSTSQLRSDTEPKQHSQSPGWTCSCFRNVLSSPELHEVRPPLPVSSQFRELFIHLHFIQILDIWPSPVRVIFWSFQLKQVAGKREGGD